MKGKFSWKCFLNYNLGFTLVYWSQLAYLVSKSQDFYHFLDVNFLGLNTLNQEVQVSSYAIADVPLVWLLYLILFLPGLFHLILYMRPSYVRKIRAQKFSLGQWIMIGIVLGCILSVTAVALAINQLVYLLVLIITMLVFARVMAIEQYLKSKLTAKTFAVAMQTKDYGYISLQACLKSTGSLSGLGPWLAVGITFLISIISTQHAWQSQHYWLYLSGCLLPAMIVFGAFASRKGWNLFKDSYKTFIYNNTVTLILISIWLWLAAAVL